MKLNLFDYQLKAINELKNGSILCGGVGSGKSLTALVYYILKVCGGSIDPFGPMKDRKDLYIITTAKKRDSLEWLKECAKLGMHPDSNIYDCSIIVDSWNNIKKYDDVYGAFFIFDEQRVIGSGAWVKAFLNITRKNQWILLSATPGDQWSDYIPVFIANGFYRNKTEFNTKHCVYSRYAKYPRIDHYIHTKELEKYRRSILVPMKDGRDTVRHNIHLMTKYDKDLYRLVFRDRWNPWENEPIEETGKLIYLVRRVVNSDPDRIQKVDEIVKEKRRVIIFYNHSYELEILRDYCESSDLRYAEWNGQKHEELPEGESWAYLVQYTAGCEGWNCITTNTIIFYSQNYSYRVTEQASGRIDRINTPYKDLYYYHLHSSANIDLAIHRCLQLKRNFNESMFLKKY